MLVFSVSSFAKAEIPPSVSILTENTPDENRAELAEDGIFDYLNVDELPATPMQMSLEDWNQINNMKIQDFFNVVVVVNRGKTGKTKQTAAVYLNGKFFKRYLVSTGKVHKDGGGPTQTGFFLPYFLDKNHKSKKYKGSPMNNSVFFNGGIATHATHGESGALGKYPASHGCVRMKEADSAELFNLVKGTHYNAQGKTVETLVPKFDTKGNFLPFNSSDPSTGRLVPYNALFIVEDKNESTLPENNVETPELAGNPSI
jgi:hypothetical protein